jgi:hypothetical protein
MRELAGYPPNRRGSPRRWRTAEQALCIQVFVHIWPVDTEASTGYAPVRALLGSRRKQTRIPHERHRDCTSIQEIDDEDVVRESDVLDALTWPTF